jgi:DNA-binding beta-propeller fold protein YncE
MKNPGCLFLTLALLNQASAQNARLSNDQRIPLDGVSGRIDHLAVDVGRNRLFVAALGNDTVEIIDLKSGKQTHSLKGFAEPQGIAFAPDLERVYVANGRDGSCRILNGESLASLGSVICGDDADNVRYDPGARRVYVGYGSGGLVVIDATAGKKLSDIKLEGHPESFQLEKSGTRIFVNVPATRQIAVIDRTDNKIVQTWKITAAASNFPMSLDETRNRLFVGCRNPAVLLVYDYSSPAGRLVASIPIGADTDDVFYDGAKRIIYASCGKGVLSLISQNDADQYASQPSIQTEPGARTCLFVPELNRLLVAVPRRGNSPAEIRAFKTQ